MIKRAYEALYIRLYRWSEKVNGKYEPHNYNASLMMTLLIFIALTILGSILILVTGWEFRATNLVKGATIFSMMAVAALNYAYFTKNDRYQELLKYDTAESKSRNSVFVPVLVCGLSILLFSIWFVGLAWKAG